MIKRIRIAIDHGNRNIKTVHTVFTTGISESDMSPAGELIIWSITESFMCRVTGESYIRERRLPIKDFSY